MKIQQNNCLLLLLAGVLLVSGWAVYSSNIPVDVNESRIWVEGTSNLHDWQCNAEQFDVNLNGDATLESLTGGNVVVLSTALDCDSNRMDRNTRDALSANEYPRIAYQIRSADVVDRNGGNFEIRLTGQLSLAGAERNVDVVAQASEMSDGRYRVTGSTPLIMSDFGIDPPRAMLGALRTADEVTVGFEIIAGTRS